MSKIDKAAIKKAIPRVVPRLLPVGALFLPLGTLTFNLGSLGQLLGGGGLGDMAGLLAGLLGGAGETSTSYSIVGAIQALTKKGPGSDLFGSLMKQDFMAAVRGWAAVTAVGLALCILAMLAGFAFIFAEKVKPLGIGALVYGAGTLGGLLALGGFKQFGAALGPAVADMASASLNYGAWVLAAMLLLNLIVCLTLWRGAKERERRAELAKKQRKKK